MDLGTLRRWLPGGRTRSASDGSGAGGPAERAAPIPASPSGSEWRGLPALHGVIGPAPLVARSRGYERELAGGRGTPLALQRLGHDRGLDAPAGLVTAVAVPLQRVPDEPVPGSVRRGRRERSRVTASRPTRAPETSVVATPTGPEASPLVRTDVSDDVAHPSAHGDTSSVAPEPSAPDRMVTRAMPLPDPAPSLVQAPQISPAPVGIVGDIRLHGRAGLGTRRGGNDARSRRSGREACRDPAPFAPAASNRARHWLIGDSLERCGHRGHEAGGRFETTVMPQSLEGEGRPAAPCELAFVASAAGDERSRPDDAVQSRQASPLRSRRRLRNGRRALRRSARGRTVRRGSRPTAGQPSPDCAQIHWPFSPPPRAGSAGRSPRRTSGEPDARDREALRTTSESDMPRTRPLRRAVRTRTSRFPRRIAREVDRELVLA